MSTADWLGVGPATTSDEVPAGTQQWLGVGGTPLKPGQLPKLAEPPPSGFAHEVGLAGEALQRGAARVLGLPGDVEALGRWAMKPWVTSEGVGVPKANEGENWLPTSNELIRGKEAEGQQGNFQPHNALERYGSEALEALPVGTLTGRAFGMKAIPSALSSLGSSVAEQSAKELLPEASWAAPLASVLGGANMGRGVATVKEEGVRALASGAEEAASGTGQIVQGQMRKWLQSDTEEGRNAFRASGQPAVNLPQKETEAWDKVSTALGSLGVPAQVYPRNYELALNDLLGAKGQMSGDLAKESSPFLLKLKRGLDNNIATANQYGSVPATDWEDAKNLRTQIGDALNDPRNRLDQARIKAAYGALTEDMRATAQAHGVLPEFEAANAASIAKHQFKEQVIDPHIAGVKSSPGQEPTPEETTGTFVRGLKKGATDFGTLETELPEAAKPIREQMIHDALLKPKLWEGLPQDSKEALIRTEENRAIMDRIAGQANGSSHQTNLLAGILASEVGSAAGVLVPKLLGGHLGGVASEALGRAAGALTPLALRKMGQIARIPEVMQGSAIGTMTSPENPLYGPMPGGHIQ